MSGKKLPENEAEERIRVGATLRQLRELQHLSQDELANAIGIARTYLSNIEAGRKPLTRKLLVRVAEVLDVRPISIVRPNYFPPEPAEVVSV